MTDWVIIKTYKGKKNGRPYVWHGCEVDEELGGDNVCYWKRRLSDAYVFARKKDAEETREHTGGDVISLDLARHIEELCH